MQQGWREDNERHSLAGETEGYGCRHIKGMLRVPPCLYSPMPHVVLPLQGEQGGGKVQQIGGGGGGGEMLAAEERDQLASALERLAEVQRELADGQRNLMVGQKQLAEQQAKLITLMNSEE